MRSTRFLERSMGFSNRLRILMNKALPVACVLVLVSHGVQADTRSERGELERLIHELDLLSANLQAAEKEAVSTARVHLEYDWLRTDLARIKAGIREYLDSVPLTPRVVEPLAGDYIR